jgi:hypothetical protein
MNILFDRSLFRRFLARNVDYFIWTMVLNILNAFIFKIEAPELVLTYLGIGFLFYSFVEAYLMTKFSTTLGKWVFKITLNPHPGSYKENLKRSIWANGLGMGFGVVFLSVFTWPIVAYGLIKNKRTLWDKDREVVVGDYSFLKLILVLVGAVVLGQLSVLIPPVTSTKKTSVQKTLIDSPHEEKSLNNEDKIYYSQVSAMLRQPFVEICVRSASAYGRYKNIKVDMQELTAYCSLGANKIVPTISDGDKLGKTACGYGLTYTVTKEKGELGDKPSDEETSFYLEFCEGESND